MAAIGVFDLHALDEVGDLSGDEREGAFDQAEDRAVEGAVRREIGFFSAIRVLFTRSSAVPSGMRCHNSNWRLSG